jgi:hypothetical protein
MHHFNLSNISAIPLVSLVYDNETNVSPEELGLLTAILQACPMPPSMDQSQTQVLNIMAEHQVFHAVSSLYRLWGYKCITQYVRDFYSSDFASVASTALVEALVLESISGHGVEEGLLET